MYSGERSLSVRMLNGPEFIKSMEEELRAGLNEQVDTLMSEFLDGVNEKLPVENGHAHEAFKAASESIASSLPVSKSLRQSITPFANAGSGDSMAKSKGEGSVSSTDTKVTVKLSINLPFVYKLEYGLPIKVGDLAGNKGPKAESTPRGSLYGPRNPGNTGLLVWVENGVTRRAKIRNNITPYGFFRNGIQKVKIKAKGK